MERRAIIWERRFWWLYPDGRMERIYMTERVKGGLSQTMALEARNGRG